MKLPNRQNSSSGRSGSKVLKRTGLKLCILANWLRIWNEMNDLVSLIISHVRIPGN